MLILVSRDVLYTLVHVYTCIWGGHENNDYR